MFTENNKRFLRRIPFFSNLNDIDMMLLLNSLSPPKTMKQNDPVCVDGSKDDGAYIILEGQCDVYKTVNGKKVKIDKVGETQVVGEMSEFLRGKRSASVVVSSEKAILLRLNIRNLPGGLREKIREDQCRIMAERLVKKNDKYSALEAEMQEINARAEEKLQEMEEQHKKEISLLQEKIKGMEEKLRGYRL